MNKAGIVLAAALAISGMVKADETPTLKLYAQPPAAVNARLSPDGTRAALIATYQGRQVLYVHSLVEGGKDSKIVRTDDFEIGWVRWKDDQHLVAGVRTSGERLFKGIEEGAISVSRLVSVDADGDHVKMIGEPEGGFFNRGDFVDRVHYVHPQHQDNVASMLPQTPGRILQIVLDKLPGVGSKQGRALYSVDIATGAHELLDVGDVRLLDYMVDGDAVARVGIERDRTDTIFHGRTGRNDPWREIQHVKMNDGEVFRPLAFLPGKSQLF